MTSKESSYRLNIQEIIFPVVDAIFMKPNAHAIRWIIKTKQEHVFRIDRTDNKNVIFVEVKDNKK